MNGGLYGWSQGHSAAGALQLAQVKVQGSPSFVDLLAIPNTYTSLRLQIAGSVASGAPNINMQFNGDTGANYSWRGKFAGLSSTADYSESGDPNVVVASISATYGMATADIVGYAQTTFKKGYTAQSVRIDSAAGDVELQLYVGTWNSLSAISSIRLQLTSSTFTNGTLITLYGIP